MGERVFGVGSERKSGRERKRKRKSGRKSGYMSVVVGCDGGRW